MKTIEKIVVFLCAYLFCGWGTFFVQNANADSSTQKLRLFAYDLKYTFEQENEETQLGTYTFTFISNVMPTEGWLIFYDQDNQELGRDKLSDEEIASRTSASGYKHTVSRTSAELAQITGNTAYLDMKWGVKLKGNTIVGQYADATEKLKNLDNYTLSSYETEGGALYQQVREPKLWVLDNRLQHPQDIAIDNNPQSPFFGRIYVANPPVPSGTTLESGAHDAGILIYTPNPADGKYQKIGGSFMPVDDAVLPATPDQYIGYYMHRIAVNPTNGDVYYCKATTSTFSAIYKLTPGESPLLANAINVTKEIIPHSATAITEELPIHPLNSLAFGPKGDLYVMSGATGGSERKSGKDTETEDDDRYLPGKGKIFKLTNVDSDGVYHGYEQHYKPQTGDMYNDQVSPKKFGFEYCISPWVTSVNSMVVTSRGSFWVTQHRPVIDAYSFLAHIAPNGYEYRQHPGDGLADDFQYSLGKGASDQYSGNFVSPLWNARQVLSPHKQAGTDIAEHANPTGAVAIYEKDGMQGDEALLAVGFKEKVCVFKLFYNEGEAQNHRFWFGFNPEWMFEIPIPGAETIDGLAFDYAGNLFIVSATTHSLYMCTLPNYGPMDTDLNPRPQPMTFNKETGERYLEISNNGATTNTSNNLDRGTPLADNSMTTIAADHSMLQDDPVDGAIVFNNVEDNQWSTENNWNIRRMPNIDDVPVVVRADANITGEHAASGVVLERNVGEERNSHITITQHGGLTVGEGGIKGAAENGSSIKIHNYSGWDQNRADRGAGYLRINPAIDPQKNPELIPNVTVNYITKSTPSKNEQLKDSNNHRLWQYVGAPGDDTQITISNHTWIYQWNAANRTWVDKGLGTITLEPFMGCAITQAYMPSYEWTTTPIIRDHTVSWDGGDYIFANSYLAPINVAAFRAEDFTGVVDKTFYIFNTGSWSEWKGAVDKEDDKAFTEGQHSGQYTAITVLNAENLNPHQDPITIAPMQGVYVRSKGSSTIKLDYTRHVWNTENPGTKAMRAPEKTVSPDLLRRIRIQAYGENSGSDRMYILQDMRCTPDYDNGYDGKNMNAAGQVNIYTNEPCGKMEISSTNQIDGMYIGFRAGPDTTYTLRFTSLIGDSLCIKDLANDSIIALYEDSTYTFYAAAKSVNNMRFQVVLHPNPADDYSNTDNSGTTTDVDNVSTSQLWMADQHLCISNQMANSTAKIYSVSGQLLISEKFNYQIDIPVYNLTTGVYILEVNNERYKFIRQN